MAPKELPLPQDARPVVGSGVVEASVAMMATHGERAGAAVQRDLQQSVMNIEELLVNGHCQKLISSILYVLLNGYVTL